LTRGGYHKPHACTPDVRKARLLLLQFTIGDDLKIALDCLRQFGH
jgi:hypothetical protein